MTEKEKETERIIVNYYTDPLCCWSWAFESHWQKFKKEFAGQISYRYIMGGMIPDWKNYNDPFNSVSRPSQMGPLWYHAGKITGVQMNDAIWNGDYPSSSWLACIAVKCAGLQSPEAEELYLLNTRKALMEDGLNISKAEVLLSIAEKTNETLPEFDPKIFRDDLKNGRGRDAFRSDLQKTKYHGIGRFPTLTFTDVNGKGIIIVGYRPYEVLLQAFESVLNLKTVAH